MGCQNLCYLFVVQCASRKSILFVHVCRHRLHTSFGDLSYCRNFSTPCSQYETRQTESICFNWAYTSIVFIFISTYVNMHEMKVYKVYLNCIHHNDNHKPIFWPFDELSYNVGAITKVKICYKWVLAGFKKKC